MALSVQPSSLSRLPATTQQQQQQQLHSFVTDMDGASVCVCVGVSVCICMSVMCCHKSWGHKTTKKRGGSSFSRAASQPCSHKLSMYTYFTNIIQQQRCNGSRASSSRFRATATVYVCAWCATPGKDPTTSKNSCPTHLSGTHRRTSYHI